MNVYSKNVIRILSLTAVLLVILGFGMQWLKFSTGADTFYGLVPLFSLGQEANLPAYFSSVLLLLSAGLLAVIAASERSKGSAYSQLWLLLCLGFVFLSADEAARIHELLVRPGRDLLGSHAMGIFYFAWVIPGMVGVAVLAVVYFKFLLALPLKYRAAFLLAAAFYLGGAIGVEMVNGRHAAEYGTENLTYHNLVALEEAMEMTGILLFINALLSYIEVNVGSTLLQFAHEPGKEKGGLARPELGARMLQPVLPFRQRKGGLE